MDSATAQKTEQIENASPNRARMGRVVGHIQPEMEEKKKKIGGFGFWCIFALAVVKDLADTILTGTVVLSIISTIVSVFVICVVWFYFYYNGVSLLSTRKLAVSLLTMTADFIPFLAVLPGFTTMVLAVRFIENSEVVKKVVEVKSGHVVHPGHELQKTA